jgi:hypothetical protein
MASSISLLLINQPWKQTATSWSISSSITCNNSTYPLQLAFSFHFCAFFARRQALVSLLKTSQQRQTQMGIDGLKIQTFN